jgi:hypothetical protein
VNVSRRRCRGRGATYLGAASLVAACAALLVIPAGASASTVNCNGKLNLDPSADAGPRGVKYSVKCTEDVKAFSMHVSKRIDYFSPDPTVFGTDGEPSDSDRFNCEGPIPGPGFGCPGAMTAGNKVVGHFATQESRCSPTVQAWVTVVTEQLTASGSPFITVSHPIRLQPPRGCAPAAASAKRANASVFGLAPIFGTLT